MCQIEWTYLPLLKNGAEVEVKFLHKKLSTDPKFFCEVISYIYRSIDDPKESFEQDEQKNKIGTNAWHLLYGWSKVPGVLDDGGFSAEQFTQWFNDAKKLCGDAGRLEPAMNEIGKVLRYTPADPENLWINRTVLAVLDDRHAEHLREGFVSEVLNSRGVHWVDPPYGRLVVGVPRRRSSRKQNRHAVSVMREGPSMSPIRWWHQIA